MATQYEHRQTQISILRKKAIAFLEMVDTPQDDDYFLKACSALSMMQTYLDLSLTDYPITQSVKRP